MRKGASAFLKGTAVTCSAPAAISLGAEKKRLLTVAFAVMFTVCATVFPKTVAEAVTSAAVGFARAALPVMLPFTVASGMLIKSGFGSVCERTVGRCFKRCFGISGSLAAPFVLGAVAGFPVGARTVTEMYKRGECGRNEAERALGLCSNPGFGFTVAGVGGVMWGDTRFGLYLWISCLLSSLAVGVLSKRKKRNDTVNLRNLNSFIAESNGVDTIESEAEGQTDFSAFRIVAEAITEAAHALLSVLVFVVFFRTISAVLLEITACLPFFAQYNGGWWGAVLTAFLEFSSGALEISSASFPQVFLPIPFAYDGSLIPRLLTVATLAWSGVSVHMQTVGFTVSCGIKMSEYYRFKMFVALVAPLWFLLISVMGCWI